MLEKEHCLPLIWAKRYVKQYVKRYTRPANIYPLLTPRKTEFPFMARQSQCKKNQEMNLCRVGYRLDLIVTQDGA